MTVKLLNPDSEIAKQLDGQWQKVVAFLLWKLSPDAPVDITDEDIKAMAARYEPHGPVVFTHGRPDGFTITLMAMDRALVRAEYEASKRSTKP